MLNTSNPTKSIQWQTLMIVVALVLVAILAAQLFFLSEEIEDTRSRNVKLSIAEILAKQQQARIKSVSFTNSADSDFSQAAEKVGRIDAGSGNIQKKRQKAASLFSSSEYKDLQKAVQGMSLVGIIRHDNYSVAIIKSPDSADPQVYSEGDLLSNNAVVARVLNDTVFVHSTVDKDALIELKMSNTPLIGTEQAASNFLNLPSNKGRQ